MSRIDTTFARLRAENRKAFVAYIMAGDPDRETSSRVLAGLPGAGVDIVELGIPFTDPMADGPTIEAAGHRALAAGGSVTQTLDMVRRHHDGIPEEDVGIILGGALDRLLSV